MQESKQNHSNSDLFKYFENNSIAYVTVIVTVQLSTVVSLLIYTKFNKMFDLTS